MRFLLGIFVFLSTTSIALAQDALPSDLGGLLSGSGFAKIVGIMIAVQLMLRGVAEGLTKLSAYTDNTWDNKVAGWLSEAAWLLGSILGKFGFGTPSEVAKEMKAEAPKPDVK